MHPVASFVATGLFTVVTVLALPRVLSADTFPQPFNTERPDRHPKSPQEALASVGVPEGFQVSLFASEPDVQQPIAATTDPRGRLWVAENYTYADARLQFDHSLRDRIVILEDADADGTMDRRTVFWDEARLLTGLEVGRGGVFVLCPPQLLFIADRDGDDRPDDEIEVLLDGFHTTTGNRHTFANGLKWGPDGWLWGRVGISSPGKVGRPGDSDSARVEVRGGIWRFHPDKRVFEMVSHGTTNPWGHDWTATGEPFFINTVIGHLWHAIPGARFDRKHGQHARARVYAMMDQHADHFHFDTGSGWMQSRATGEGVISEQSDPLGGGHAHAGVYIVQDVGWPETFQGRLLTLNFHGRRVNTERLEREGSGYVGRHEPDFMTVGDPWFRGLDLVRGPGGSVYILDWSDTGECHESDGIHRTSGRIYRLTPPGDSRRIATAIGLTATMPSATGAGPGGWVERLVSEDAWVVRQTRQQLADAYATGEDLSSVADELRRAFEEEKEKDVPWRLSLLWALWAIGGVDDAWLLGRTRDSDEAIRSWAVRLLADRWPFRSGETQPTSNDPIPDAVMNRWTEMSQRSGEDSGLVRLYLASALQRVPIGDREQLATHLMSRREDSVDPNLPLMLWYGIEPLVSEDPDSGVRLFAKSEMSQVRQFIARLLMEQYPKGSGVMGRLLRRTIDMESGRRLDLLRGMAEGGRGRRDLDAPAGWGEWVKSMSSESGAETVSSNARDEDGVTADSARETRRLMWELGALFRDDAGYESARSVARDVGEEPGVRLEAFRTLLESDSADAVEYLRATVTDGVLGMEALIALVRRGEASGLGLARERLMTREKHGRAGLIEALSARPEGAVTLLGCVAAGGVGRNEISAFQARQMAMMDDSRIHELLKKSWGVVRLGDSDSATARSLIEEWRGRLTPDVLKSGNVERGAKLYDSLCAACHRLHGRGGNLGPDLTGSGRSDLGYLLENTLNPGSVVAEDYRVVITTLTDGRVLSGMLRERTNETLTMESPTGRWVLNLGEVQELEVLEQSLMPEGLLNDLSIDEVRDLMAYLMK